MRHVPAARRENSVPVGRTLEALVSPRRENEMYALYSIRFWLNFD